MILHDGHAIPAGDDPDVLMTPQEVADVFRVVPKVPARWADKGLISCVRTPGGHRRYLRTEIEAFLTPTLEGAK